MKELNNITPIFLLSLPRSGSTLLQRILITNEDISSTSEPWVLLPILNMLKTENVRSTYGHKSTVDAIDDFYSSLSKGRDGYLKEIRKFTLSLYKSHGDTLYFLDKTPRYSLVVDEIYQTFPEGKYIVLWRNPLAIIASALSTWKKEKWSISHLKIDLYNGLENLINFYESNSSQVFALKYEDIVSDTDSIEQLFSYLGIKFNKNEISKFSNINLSGRMGDKTGVNKYSEITQSSKDGWKSMLASPVRKWWCRRYLRWIGKERLIIMGYDIDLLLNELDAIPNRYNSIIDDSIRLIYGEINIFFGIDSIKENIKKFLNKQIIYPYF